ncbi:MAG: DUF4168 domain-containing protein [Leptolyngbyaceae cyanobacterium bins.349]|nr:DUF4168 domain-containing protein [Leptolyngbyaceae cyanobacterium bins.349]
MIKHILASGALAVLLGTGSLPVLAQQKPAPPASTTQQAVSEDDLKKFVNAAKKLEVISQERNTQIAKVVKDEGLSLERFREIYLSKQNNRVKPKTEVTQDEQQKYDRAVGQLAQIQKDTQSKMGTAVQSEGLEVPRFLQILEAIQKAPDLQKRVDQMLKTSK